jgi:hypothetical protein
MNFMKMFSDLAEGFREGYNTSNSEASKSSDTVICRNCGHEMGWIQKNRLHGGILKNPCEDEGKYCVPLE